MERPWPGHPGLSLLLTITAGLNLLPFAALLAFSLQGGNGVLGIGNDGLTQLSNTVLLVLLVGIGVAAWARRSAGSPPAATLQANAG